MTHADQYGLTLTTDSHAAAAAYVDALDHLLSGRIGARERLQDALALDPNFALARAALAFQGQFQTRPLVPVGEILLASRDATRASPRERQWIDALRHAIAGHLRAADRALSAHLEEFPRDALALRQHVAVVAYGGDRRRKARIAEQLEGLAGHFGADPWFLGMHSLVRSEVGDAPTALRLATTGLELRPDHGGLAHGMAHAHFEAGDDVAGRNFLAGWLAEYGERATSAGHLTWHLALVHVALGDPEHGLALYRDRQRATAKQGFRIEDAASLLWRLWLRGIDVGSEWDVVVRAEPSVGPSRAFEWAHRALALAATGDENGVARLAEAVRGEATHRPDAPFDVLGELLEPLRLVARRQWVDAAPLLERACISARRLGGSNEQHTLFDETVAFAVQAARASG